MQNIQLLFVICKLVINRLFMLLFRLADWFTEMFTRAHLTFTHVKGIPTFHLLHDKEVYLFYTSLSDLLN